MVQRKYCRNLLLVYYYLWYDWVFSHLLPNLKLEPWKFGEKQTIYWKPWFYVHLLLWIFQFFNCIKTHLRYKLFLPHWVATFIYLYHEVLLIIFIHSLGFIFMFFLMVKKTCCCSPAAFQRSRKQRQRRQTISIFFFLVYVPNKSFS